MGFSSVALRFKQRFAIQFEVRNLMGNNSIIYRRRLSSKVVSSPGFDYRVSVLIRRFNQGLSPGFVCEYAAVVEL